MNILFVDACPRKESRTRALAEEVLKHLDGTVTRLKLTEAEIPVIDESAVTARDADGRSGSFEAPIYALARQFAEADCIVMAAPLWDLSFPALLKQYIEAITVSGITFRYSEQGIPIGLCRAKRLYYVTTAGGPIFNEEYGWGYIRMLAQKMYGIPDCQCFKAENLDVWGQNPDELLKQAAGVIEKYFSSDSCGKQA